MRRIILVALVSVGMSCAWPFCCGHSHSAEIKRAEIKRAADAPKPHSPEESLKMFRLSKGFRIELVAAEPLLADPIAMAFDAKGRIFVCELHGYNLEGHLDVTELNKTGVLDTQVRRINAPKEILKQAEKGQCGTVKLLEDTDGDGRMDTATVWADGLPLPYGLVPARGGIIVLCAPDIIFLADRDGDGKAEVRRKLFSGFGCRLTNIWSRINNPRWCVDNWIYGVNGSGSGGTVHGPALPREVKIGSVCFRFKSDGSLFEPCSGSTSGFGQAITDWGDRFICTNQQHALLIAPLPYRYLSRNPYYAAPKPTINICTYGSPAEVYPISQPHPWRLARSKDPRWMKFYGAKEATANGFFTAASGQTVYRATQFPAEYHGNHFSVDNAQNMVHRCLLYRDGAGYKVKRATEEKREFLSSTEHWFRPVNLLTGPDGALYVVDMYREIIEDYSAIPRYLQQQYGMIEGCKRGRIYRVVADGAPRPRKFDLTKATAEELVAQLANTNGWWRQTAQRLLVERADKTAAAALAALVREGRTPQARLHAIYTLDGLGSLEPALIEHALADPHYAIRMHALRLAENRLDGTPGLLEKTIKMVDDSDPSVRLQLAYTLGQSKDQRAVDALASLAMRRGNERWMQAAVVSSSADSADRLLGEILEKGADSPGGPALLHPLASTVGARHDDAQIGSLLATVAAAKGAAAKGAAAGPLQVACLKGLIEGLKRGKPKILGSSAGQQALGRLLENRSAEIQKLSLSVAGLVKLNQSEKMKKAIAAAGKTALDEKQPVPQRVAAIRLLKSAPADELLATVEELLDARQPLEVQLAAVETISSTDNSEVTSILLANWQAYTPKVQDAVLDAIFSRQNRLAGLLDAVKQGTVLPSGLDAPRRVQLRENPDAKIRDRAKSLLSSQTSDKRLAEVLARYRAALTGPCDTKRGKLVYDDQCAKCHKLKGEGFEVGPDLSAVNNRADETLVADILDPNSQITAGYRNYTVITEDGRIFTGVLSAETATSITLRKEEGVEEVILRKDIDEMAASPNSMMPEEFDKEVSPQNVADLIAFLRETLGPLPPPAVVLFEDDPELVKLLASGDGTVRLDSADRFSGKASLVVTPQQRFNLRIPGWEYVIAENPEPGQFRYIRFAWKSRGGQGVMIELAADGNWPPAEKALRRYYSGNNSTGWQAVEVSPNVPEQWVVVTRDLWKDFGSFTLTGIAPTAIGGEALFDRIELLRSLDETEAGK